MKVWKDLKSCYGFALTMRFLSDNLSKVSILVEMSIIGRW